MNIAVDAGLASSGRGMGNYISALLREMARLPSSHRFTIYTSPGCVPPPEWLPGRSVALGPRNYVVREQLTLAYFCARDRVDLLHCPGNTCPAFLPRRIKLVVTLHDVMFMMQGSALPFSESIYQRLGTVYRRLIAHRVARQATMIITDSQISARDIQRYLGFPRDRIRVVYGAPAQDFRPVARAEAETVLRNLQVPTKFVLAPGGIDPRKNTRRVIEAFALASEVRKAGIKLILVGIPEKWTSTFIKYARRWGVETDLMCPGFVPREQLVALYNCAEFVLYPSLYEGFGLPVLEAMACGTPVISSTGGSIPEVAADAALLVDPTDVGAIAEAMTNVVSDNGLRQRLVEKGFERARQFSWERAARETMEVYRECLQG